mmetsp:Transcript_96/g.179  ORF Transcript_96/g.179 Transcript_96/m.179 type:complete len:162 (-) Transcript_96:429-914(-)
MSFAKLWVPNGLVNWINLMETSPNRKTNSLTPNKIGTPRRYIRLAQPAVAETRTAVTQSSSRPIVGGCNQTFTFHSTISTTSTAPHNFTSNLQATNPTSGSSSNILKGILNTSSTHHTIDKITTIRNRPRLISWPFKLFAEAKDLAGSSRPAILQRRRNTA